MIYSKCLQCGLVKEVHRTDYYGYCAECWEKRFGAGIPLTLKDTQPESPWYRLGGAVREELKPVLRLIRGGKR